MKWAIAAGAVLFVALAVLGYGRERYADGVKQGKATIQAQWDKARQVAQQEYDRAAQAAAELAAADRAAAEEVENGLREQVVAADAAARDLARRLRDATRTRGGCSAVPGTPESTRQLAGESGEPSGDEAIGRATEDLLAACAKDATRLDGWDNWWAGVEANR